MPTALLASALRLTAQRRRGRFSRYLTLALALEEMASDLVTVAWA